MGASLLAVLVVSVLLAAVARRYDVSAPLALVVAGLAAWERLGRDEEKIGESPVSAFRRLRLEMLAAERATLIAERDSGQIDDEVLRNALRGLGFEGATLNRG